MDNSDSVFDRVLHSVGDDGKYQRRCNVIFNFFLAAMGTMAYMNLILAMTVPDHWCKVPGRDEGNISLDVWKQLTLPREKDSAGHDSFSSCHMYNQTELLENQGLLNKTEKISCQYGYEYDGTWSKNTMPSSQDWVCEKELYISNVLAATRVGEVVAGFVFGYLGDTIGRRPVFLLAVGITCLGRFVSAFVAHSYWLFLAASVVATLPSTTAAQSCLVLIMELSPPEDRAFIAQMQNFGWTLGLCLLPLIYWLSQDWAIYIIASTAPLLLYFPLCIFLVESPRWLLSRGRVTECLQQLIRIAKVNGTRLSPDGALLLQSTAPVTEKLYGIGSLFSNWRLAKNTTLTVTGWVCSILSYNTLVLNISSLNGNPFLNFFLQAVAELPSYILGRILCDRLGRRFSGGFGFIMAIIGFVTIVFTIHDPALAGLQVFLNIVAKFSVSVCFFVSSLQALEIYPTCLRQGGFTFGMVSGCLFSVFAPYIVYSGVMYDARIPYVILTGVCILGLLTQIFLPETLHQKLPETLQEARSFGEYQGYWSFPSKKDDLYVLANLKSVNRQLSDYCDNEN